MQKKRNAVSKKKKVIPKHMEFWILNSEAKQEDIPVTRKPETENYPSLSHYQY